MENHYFQWVNPVSIAMLNYQRVSDFPKKMGSESSRVLGFQNVSKSSEQSGCALTEVTAKVAEGIRHFLKYTLW